MIITWIKVKIALYKLHKYLDKDPEDPRVDEIFSALVRELIPRLKNKGGILANTNKTGNNLLQLADAYKPEYVGPLLRFIDDFPYKNNHKILHNRNVNGDKAKEIADGHNRDDFHSIQYNVMNNKYLLVPELKVINVQYDDKKNPYAARALSNKSREESEKEAQARRGLENEVRACPEAIPPAFKPRDPAKAYFHKTHAKAREDTDARARDRAEYNYCLDIARRQKQDFIERNPELVAFNPVFHNYISSRDVDFIRASRYEF